MPGSSANPKLLNSGKMASRHTRADYPLNQRRGKTETTRPDTAGVASTAGMALPVLGADAVAAPASRPQLKNPPIVSFVSLGCAKNLVDSEKMLGQLVESGAILSGDESAADTVVVNTCGFLEASRLEALEILGELAERKRAGNLRRIVVAGCLVQRDGEKLRDEVPEIDALVGVNNRDDVVRAVWRMDRDAAVSRYMGDYHGQPWTDLGRLRLTPRHYAYVRISEGCNQKCTFCTIPSIRGPMHCKSPAELVEEGRELIADGARELLLIGQDTTSYGEDIGYAGGLAGLLRELDRSWDGADWIRLMYVYPTAMTDEIIAAIAESPRIVKYIDIPLQHINDRMLKAMARRVTRRETEALLEKLRSRIPGVTIRTTFITGFPGETEAEFAELERFVQEFEFDAVGAFTFSLERETPSGRMKEQVPDELKQERYERLMLAQQEVALRRAKERIGAQLEVVVDSAASEPGVMIARHAGQAPEVDAVSLLVLDEEGDTLDPGTVVAAEVVDTADYDLVVRPA